VVVGLESPVRGFIRGDGVNDLDPAIAAHCPIDDSFNLISECENAPIDEDERRYVRRREQIISGLQEYFYTEIILLLRVLDPGFREQCGSHSVFIEYYAASL